MRYRLMIIMMVICAFVCFGCNGKDDQPDDKIVKIEGRSGELNLVSRSPEETFYGIKEAFLAEDLDKVYLYYSKGMKMYQDREDLQKVYDASKPIFFKKFNGAQIVPGSVKRDKSKGAINILWGDGYITSYLFLYEADGWKLDREAVQLLHERR